jgi:hypothetical protein
MIFWPVITTHEFSASFFTHREGESTSRFENQSGATETYANSSGATTSLVAVNTFNVSTSTTTTLEVSVFATSTATSFFQATTSTASGDSWTTATTQSSGTGLTTTQTSFTRTVATTTELSDTTIGNAADIVVQANTAENNVYAAPEAIYTATPTPLYEWDGVPLAVGTTTRHTISFRAFNVPLVIADINGPEEPPESYSLPESQTSQTWHETELVSTTTSSIDLTKLPHATEETTISTIRTVTTSGETFVHGAVDIQNYGETYEQTIGFVSKGTVQGFYNHESTYSKSYTALNATTIIATYNGLVFTGDAGIGETVGAAGEFSIEDSSPQLSVAFAQDSQQWQLWRKRGAWLGSELGGAYNLTQTELSDLSLALVNRDSFYGPQVTLFPQTNESYTVSGASITYRNSDDSTSSTTAALGSAEPSFGGVPEMRPFAQTGGALFGGRAFGFVSPPQLGGKVAPEETVVEYIPAGAYQDTGGSTTYYSEPSYRTNTGASESAKWQKAVAFGGNIVDQPFDLQFLGNNFTVLVTEQNLPNFVRSLAAGLPEADFFPGARDYTSL